LHPPKTILYADDDVDDRLWVSEACKLANLPASVRFLENGRQVIDYLRVRPASNLPSLIVLALNMPEMDGRQTLKQLKATPAFQNIPVAIVTTSSNKMDQEVCKRLGASVYLTKPYTHGEWQEVMRQLEPLISS
jgi:CheY-like chemotaxis protein